jgi:hypothetical protein
MFLSSKMAKDAQCHESKRKPVKNELSHPTDGDAWKQFKKSWPESAEDARNLRLGLVIDGFNPSGNMTNSYSMWPVFFVSYNMPPWVCIEESNFMMALLIPGSSSPSKDFDIFMEPLERHDNFGRESGQLMLLRVKNLNYVLWFFGAYKDPCSRRLKNKICYIGHRRFLKTDHPWRRKQILIVLLKTEKSQGSLPMRS